MAFDYAKFVRKSFDNVGPKNPLRELDDSDKHLLVSLLFVHAKSPKDDQATAPLEEVAAIAAEAGALAKKLESSVFGGSLAPILASILGGTEDLPARLKDFSNRMGSVLEQAVGKRGQKHKVLNNQFLIMASELVRLRTGKHHDEHLADLLQTLPPRAELIGEDVSGDSIRKKREHLKRAYPVAYALAVKRVQIRAGQ
jgi:hypothetical protein